MNNDSSGSSETRGSSRAGPSGLRRLIAGLKATHSAFESLPLHDQACFLTLPLLLLYVDDFWYVRVPILGLALAGLLFANVRSSPFFWFAITCFLTAGLCYNWWEVDNHKYLMCYWCLAIFLSRWHPHEDGALAASARYLLGLTFCFAVLWKVVSPDFSSGDFFFYSFLFDSRFTDKLQVLGLVDPDLLELNDLARRALVSYDSQLESVQTASDPRLRTLALGLAWWTYAIEGAIAISFLIPRRLRLSRVRDCALWVFLVSTYPVAPVIGFGWLLVTLGFVQTEAERKKTRFFYLVVLLLLQAFRLPWSSIAESMAQ